MTKSIMALPVVILVTSVALRAAGTPDAQSADAGRGLKLYAANCASCHGVDMSGSAMAPALKGPEFAFGWKDKSPQQLSDFIKTNMPPGRSGMLADQQYRDISAAIESSH